MKEGKSESETASPAPDFENALDMAKVDILLQSIADEELFSLSDGTWQLDQLSLGDPTAARIQRIRDD